MQKKEKQYKKKSVSKNVPITFANIKKNNKIK